MEYDSRQTDGKAGLSPGYDISGFQPDFWHKFGSQNILLVNALDTSI
jgi:hypothetical protein